MVIGVIVVVLAGFLLLWWEIRQLRSEMAAELIEIKTHLADISEEKDDRTNEAGKENETAG